MHVPAHKQHPPPPEVLGFRVSGLGFKATSISSSDAETMAKANRENLWHEH